MTDPADPKFPDLRYVRELAKLFRQYELDELEIEAGDQRILLRQSDVAPVTVAAAQPVHAPVAAAVRPVLEVAVAPVAEAGEFITSPFVGTFYRSARPELPSFVEVGKRVASGDTVCIIEAMKLFNEIEADFACVIEEVLVENASPLEYGTKMFRVRKL